MTQVLALPSINSEGNRRAYYRNDQAKVVKPGRPNDKPVDRKTSAENLWDMPSGTPGSFGADGVFSFGAAPFSASSGEKARTLSERLHHPEVKDDPLNDLGRLPVAGFGGPVRTNDLFNARANPLLNQFDPSANPLLNQFDASRISPAEVGMPPFRFTPPQWVYKDPEGQYQGPFSSEQMHAWCKDGYFPPNLPIKCMEDTVFIPLFQFMEKYGAEAPFL